MKMLGFYLSLIETEEDKSKFENIYETYRKVMFYAANQILNDEYLAEDAVHSAFLRIMEHIDNIDTNNCHKTKGYVIIIVRNVTLQMYNKRKKTAETPITFIEDTSSGESLEDDVLSRVEDERIFEAMKTISEKYSEILMLKYYHNCNDKEISKILDIGGSAARKRLERARKSLFEVISNGDEK